MVYFCMTGSFCAFERVVLHLINFLIFSVQCLMYLYHYPDMWYDYATWHAKSGSVDSAIKVFHRALKALPGTDYSLFCLW